MVVSVTGFVIWVEEVSHVLCFSMGAEDPLPVVVGGVLVENRVHGLIAFYVTLE